MTKLFVSTAALTELCCACRAMSDCVFPHMLGLMGTSSDAADASLADKLKSVNDEKVLAQLKHQAASHVFELLLLHTPAEAYAAVWGLVEAELMELCMHQTANFAVQALIAAAPAADHVASICRALLPRAADLIAARRPGILCVLAASSACWQTCCAEVCTAVWQAQLPKVRDCSRALWYGGDQLISIRHSGRAPGGGGGGGGHILTASVSTYL